MNWGGAACLPPSPWREEIPGNGLYFPIPFLSVCSGGEICSQRGPFVSGAPFGLAVAPDCYFRAMSIFAQGIATCL